MSNPTQNYETVSQKAKGKCPSQSYGDTAEDEEPIQPVKTDEIEVERTDLELSEDEPNWFCPVCHLALGDEENDEMLQRFRKHTI